MVAQRADGLVVHVFRHTRKLRRVRKPKPCFILDHEVDIHLVRLWAYDADIRHIPTPFPRIVFIGVPRPGAAINARRKVDAPGQAVVVLGVQSARTRRCVAHAGNVRNGVYQYFDCTRKDAAALRSGFLSLHHNIRIALARLDLGVLQAVEILPVLGFHPRSRRDSNNDAPRLLQAEPHRGRGPFRCFPGQPHQRRQRIQGAPGAGFQHFHSALCVRILHGLIFHRAERFNQQVHRVGVPDLRVSPGQLPVISGVQFPHLIFRLLQGHVLDEVQLRAVLQLDDIRQFRSPPLGS